MKSLLVHGPKACGKTVNSARLLDQHYLTKVVECEELPIKEVEPEGALYLTNMPVDDANAFAAKHNLRVLPFEEAMTKYTSPINGRFITVGG